MSLNHDDPLLPVSGLMETGCWVCPPPALPGDHLSVLSHMITPHTPQHRSPPFYASVGERERGGKNDPKRDGSLNIDVANPSFRWIT